MIGPVRFPEIIETKSIGSGVEITCIIPLDLSYCEGHFPEIPIVPGVVQLHWAVHYAQKFIGSFEEVLGASQIKFSNIIKPGSSIVLGLKHDESSCTIHYVYKDCNKSYSSGRFIYRNAA